MPRDSNGIYSLPSGYQAVAGQTIQPSQHNPPLLDIATGLTNSLPRDGSAPMTAQLKGIDGSAATPAYGFNSTTGLGLFKSSNGIGFAIGGTQVAEVGPTGFLAGLPIGTPVPVLDDTLPAACIWADGRNVSRTTYAALFAKWATKYGAGDGSTTFGVVDLRGVPLVGRDNIGGTDASRLSGAPIVSGDRLTTGSVIGETSHVNTIAEMANHNHSGAVGQAGVHQHIYRQPGNATAAALTGSSALVVSADVSALTDAAGLHDHIIPSQGGGAAHNNVQRSFLCNFAIYAGA